MGSRLPWRPHSPDASPIRYEGNGTRVRNQVQLITYAERLGANLGDTIETVKTVFAGACGGVHLLPFFDAFDGADAGFDPIDHTRVDPRLGSWSDVRALASTHDVVVDVIVNHVSSQSKEFLDFREYGENSEFADMFLTFDTVFPHGATARDLTAIYRPRPGLPFTSMLIGGERRLVWTTFTADQIDIDVSSEPGARYLARVLDQLAASGVTMVRLDAAGYAVKKAGSSCFLEPEAFEFIDEFTAEAHARGLEVLVEVHSYFQRQVEIAVRVDWVYDFALAPLVLHALTAGDADPLGRWLATRPTNAITVLDTHDGIGVVDVGPSSGDDGGAGLLTPHQIDALVQGIHGRTGGQSRSATGQGASNVDIYQVNSTFYSALGCDDAAYLAARCLQFFVPGVPQVYYVGALAGANDMALFANTGVGRDINRHHFTRSEIDERATSPVVESLLALMRFRNEHPAFAGRAKIDHSRAHIAIDWWRGGHWARVRLDTHTRRVRLSWTTASGDVVEADDLLSLSATLQWGRVAGSKEPVSV